MDTISPAYVAKTIDTIMADIHLAIGCGAFGLDGIWSDALHSALASLRQLRADLVDVKRGLA